MKGPIFIAGCGRSGTSYLRTIVDAHPDVFIPNESLFLVDYLRSGAAVPARLLQWLFFREPQLLCWYDGDKFDFSDITDAIIRCHENEMAAAGASVWGQKTPRFVRHRQLFEMHFPNIRWLLLYRDPRGVAASMKKSRQHTYSMVKVCDRWLKDNAEISKFLKADCAPPNVRLVKYEELVLDYDSMLESIFRFLDLNPISAEEVNQRGRPVFFKRSRFKINTIRGDLRPDPSLVDSWQRELSNSEIAYIEKRCSNLMATMGYEPVSSVETESYSGASAILPALKDASIVWQYISKWPEYLYITALRKVLFAISTTIAGKAHTK